MKNIYLNLHTNLWNKVLLFSFFLFTSQITLASVDPTSFTVTGTNGTCLSNASIKVTVPAGDYNSGWTAYISKTGYSSEQVVPVIGGDIVFNSLAPGNYNVELKETFRALPTQQVTLTTNYVDFTLGNTYKLPSASCPGSTDGELTVKVLSGGAGPFKYDVSYPTPAPGTGTTTQTYTGSERNHTFLNVPGGIVVNYTVTDFVGGASGCENSKTQNPTLGNVSVSTVDFYGLSPFNFVRTSNTKCNNPTLFVNLVNVDAARDAVISATGNAFVEIKNASGTLIATKPLTRISNIRYTYNPAAVGGPELENNWTVTVKINWGCSILQRTSTVAVGNNWVNHNIKYAINSSCTVDYVWYLLGENQTPEGNRNMYFLADNKLRFEKWNGSAWVAVPSTDVTPDPATMYNPLGVIGAYTGTLPSANGQFIFKTPGSYRYFASDDCHTVSSTFNFVTKTNPINEVSVVQSKSVLQGTSGIKITIGTPLKPNFTMKISRADGKTSIPFTATGPLNMAGSYTATFPKNATITSTSSVGGYWDFSDLPLGDYIVELSDGCGSTRTVNITLNQPAEYTSTFTPILSCTGSNKISYNLGQNANAYVAGIATLYRDNGLGAPGASLTALSGTSGTFINLNAGDYVVAFNGVGAGLSSVSGVTYLKSYYQKVKIAPYGGIEIETSSVMCDPTDNTSGIVNVELVNNDVLTPTTIKLFSASDMTTPIRNVVLAAGETGTVFQNIAVGNYVVRVTNECTSIDKNISITTGSTGTAPIAKVNRPKVCSSDKTIKLAITASNRLYDVVWTNSSNTVVGNTTPLELTDPINTTYTATFKLKSIFNCANVQEYTSSVDVVVTADPDLSSAVAVSDIDLCLNTSSDFTISNTQAGFKYELTDKDGISYATPIYSAESTGGTITMTIPTGITLIAGNTFKIKAISGGCSGFLTDVVSITSKQNNLNLDVITPTAMICSGTDSTLTIKNTESGVTYTVKKNGVTIPSGTVTGTGSDKNFNIPATFLTAGTNEFIVSTSGSGCQNGDLTQRRIINVNTAPVISATKLTPIIVNGCNDVVAPAAVTTVADLETMGVTIADDNTNDASLVVSSTDSAITGTSTTKYITRTYKITDSCNKFTTVIQNIVLNITTPIAPTISTATATTFCEGGSVILESSALTGNQWYRNNILISGATERTYIASVSGTYTVVTTNIHTCSSPVSDGIMVVANPSVAPTPINSTIANDCPLETVDLTTLQPAAVSGIEFEWWTGNTTTRTTRIINTANYNTSGAVFLWSKSTSDACYSLQGQRVDVVITPCCVANVGIIENTNSNNLVHYSPADINGYEHKNYSTPNKTVYVLVNELDQKIKYINTTSPQFTRVVEGNYKLHALVFGPTVNPTGIVVGNKINQIQIPDYCGSTASYALRVAPNNCISNPSFTEDIPNAKQYALIDLATNQFIQVSTNGEFATSFTGIPYQVVGFNYTGVASGIEVGGTLLGVTATSLDITAGAIISGCTAVITQIDGNLYNDKSKRCIEGSNGQDGLPFVDMYAKLLNSNNQVVAVSQAIQAPGYTFSFAPNLMDGTYSIILDDNHDLADIVATYPVSWKGSKQTFTVESGQIVEQLSNTANFVPMCMQSATEKPSPKKTANLQGNTYHFCFDQTVTNLTVDADSRAVINWYTSPTGGAVSNVAPLPNTKEVGIVSYYVSQTLNGAESDRTEIKIEVHPLPQLPSVISGPILVGSETKQQYSVLLDSSLLNYNWTLPIGWTGSSVTRDINVVVGQQGGTIKVNAVSSNGCIGPAQQLDVRVVIEDDIEIYNSISPNGDGVNDELLIRNIDFYPNNTLEIYNRWGVLVYEANGYGQNDVLFKGLSDGRTTINRNEELPEGSYFYTLTYINSKGIKRQKAGYLYIKQ